MSRMQARPNEFGLRSVSGAGAYVPSPPKQPGSFSIYLKAIKFSGAGTAYNPLYDRALASKIDPPQWQKVPDQKDPTSQPISYVKGTQATLAVDIAGTPKLSGTPIEVRVTVSGKLWQQVLVKNNTGELEVKDAPGVGTPITFQPTSQTIRVTNWDHEDYGQLRFTTQALPNTVRFDKLKIEWCFEYRYNRSGPWLAAGRETTDHELYITYARAYEGFEPNKYPWTQVLRRACFYAHGQKDIIGIARRVTTGIYNSLEFEYTQRDTHSWYNNGKIKLWDMLRDGWMDCQDGSNYWTIMLRWLGISANQIKINEQDHIKDKAGNPIVYNGFYYKTLRPISSDPNIKAEWRVRDLNNAGSNWWDFHQVGVLEDIHTPVNADRTRVYDPTIKLNRNAPIVPVNASKAAYKLALFDPRPFPFPDLLWKQVGKEIKSIFKWSEKLGLVEQVI